MPKSKLTPRELVLQKYPTAHEYDDGDCVKIVIDKMLDELCPHCKQKWTRIITDLALVLGSGGDGEAAWKSAAQRLGLIKNY